jgi:DNA-directed RNA polymerase subunit RPC12/RpoP
MLDAMAAMKIRRAAVLGAGASWVFVLLLADVAFLAVLGRGPAAVIGHLARELFFVLIGVGSALWALALFQAWPVRCPHCNQQLLITYRMSDAGGPRWRALCEQLWPVRLLSDARTMCPHCAAVVDFGGGPGA